MDFFFNVKNWRTLELDELYHPRYQFYLHAFINATFLPSVICYTFTVYVIFTKSTKPMETFKFTAFLQLSWNLVYQIYLIFVVPIMHWPLPLISSNSYFPLNQRIVIYSFAWFICIVLGGGLSFLMALGNRLLAVFRSPLPTHWLIIVHCGIFIVAAITCLVPFFLLFGDLDQIRHQFEVDAPVVAEIFKKLPATIGIHPHNSMLYWLCGILFFWVVLGCLLFVVLFCAFVYRLVQASKTVKRETYFLHQLLLRTLLTHLLVSLLFALGPVGLLYVLLIFQFRWASWITALLFPVSSLHLIFDCSLLLYFVKPYRIYVKSIAESNLGLLNFRTVAKVASNLRFQ